MGNINALNKKLLPLLAAALSVLFLSSCASRVVIGRARPSEPVAQEKANAPKPVQKKPVEVKEAQKAPAEAQTADAAKTEPSKTALAQENVVPQSSPARPAQVANSDEKTNESIAPYKLDLSFGGFGLGVGLFDTPVAIAVDDQENMYVVDQGNFRVQKFDRFGIFQFSWGRQGMGEGEFTQTITPRELRMTGDFEFNKPVGILVDKDETRNLTRATVVDSLNNRIQRFLLVEHPGDQFPTSSDPQTSVFIKLTSSGNVIDDALKNKYTAESRQVILDPIYLRAGCNKANQNLLSPFVWGGLGYTQGLFSNPTYIAKDENNILYVSDTENGRVQGFYLTPSVCSTDATFYREWGNDINLPYGAGRLKEPTAIAYDNTGFGGFLVLDKLQGGSYNIQRFDRNGQFVGVFAVSGDKEGQFRQPVGIAINTFDNTVFITDKSRRKVMVYNNKGEYMYEFGGEELADPRGIAVLRNNYIYVTDAAKNMVYRYVPQ